MRLALISDVHANLPALEAVLGSIAADAAIDATFHLGDLVGYAPWPNETVDRIARAGIAGVAGNYDSTVATDYEHCGCRYEDPGQALLAHHSFEWTKAHTSPGAKRWLARLPFRLDVRPFGGHTTGPTLRMMHGGPILNTFYWTEDRADAFCESMAATLGAKVGDVIAFGHTHRAWHRIVAGIHFVNTGSVGKPKDGDPRAGYVTTEFTGSDIDVSLRRIDYDVVAAAKAIRASSLPTAFAEMLETGGNR